MRLWVVTIEKARQNTDGMRTGIHFDNLGLVLYNAGLCNQKAGMTVEASLLANESLDICMEALRGAMSLVEMSDEAVMSKVRTEHPLLGPVTQLIESLGGELGKVGFMGSSSGDSEVYKVQGVQGVQGGVTQGNTVEGNVKVAQMVHTVGGVRYVTEAVEGGGEVEEWEECGEFEEDCESLYVYDDEGVEEEEEEEEEDKKEERGGINGGGSGGSGGSHIRDTSQEVPPFIPVATEVSIEREVEREEDDDDESIYEGLDAEEREELMEIRERYAQRFIDYTSKEGEGKAEGKGKRKGEGKGEGTISQGSRKAEERGAGASGLMQGGGGDTDRHDTPNTQQREHTIIASAHEAQTETHIRKLQTDVQQLLLDNAALAKKLVSGI